MKKSHEDFLNYMNFNSISNSEVTAFNKLILVFFFIYIILTFSDEGMINALSEQIISEYNISQGKYSLIKLLSCLGQIFCSIILIKLIKKIIHSYKIFGILILLIKSIILMSYNFQYSFFIFLLTRFISNIIRLYEFVFFISWFSQQLKKPIFSIYGLIIVLLCIQLGNEFGYLFNYLNLERAKTEHWRHNFLFLGIVYLIFAFLLMVVSTSKNFKLKKNIYYPPSRWGSNNLNNEYNRNNSDLNSTESSDSIRSNSFFNLDTLKQLKDNIEKIENKNNLYDLSLEEKLKQMTVSEFNYYLELKTMIKEKKYFFSLISLSILSLIYDTILFWGNNYIINYLSIKEPSNILMNYSCIALFGPALGIALNRAVQITINNKKKEFNIFLMIICLIMLSVLSIFIQTKNLRDYFIIFLLIYIANIFYLLIGIIILHLKYTQFTFKKEDFIITVLSKNLLGDVVGNIIYIYFINNDSTMNGMGMIINFSWILLGVFGSMLLFEFNTAENNGNVKEINEDKKIKNYRTTITSDIQGEELKEIEQRESIISVDDNEDDNNINNFNNENEYNLDDYVKK